MLSIAFKCEVPPNRIITLNLAEEIEPGEHELVLMIDPETSPAPLRRQPGSAKGKVIILADDEEYMADFANYMP